MERNFETVMIGNSARHLCWQGLKPAGLFHAMRPGTPPQSCGKIMPK